MPRRNESVFDTLLVLPWWVGILAGVAGYVALAVLLPMIWKDQMLGAIAQGILPVASVWLVVCFLAAAGSAVRKVHTAQVRSPARTR